ncbi:MAG TPA: diguanylate cyclase [Polyangiales bacterium]|jgi:two-component system chemotaxis family response regulator WspR|nr:diguanylate cyclase [Polyangiales bacterium]
MTQADNKRTHVVLLVDDQAIVAEAIRRMLLDQPDLEFHHCADVARALPMARSVRPTVILQDLVMPEVDGFTLVRFFRADSDTANVPIIVLSSKDDPRDKSRAFETGANDYLVKVPDKVELVARVRAHSRSYVAHLERDEALAALQAVKIELEAKNAQLERLTTQDPLTELANRRRFDELFDLEWRRAQREQSSLSVIMADVDYFKAYNDTYGHQVGDECLRRVAEVLRSGGRRPPDTAARYGGEEFALILPNTPEQGACGVAEILRERVAQLGIAHSGSTVAAHVTLSLGLACCVPSPDHSASRLLAAADAALYEAKRSGRNRWVCASAMKPPT